MTTVVVACCLLLLATSMVHYEVLRFVNALLPRLAVPLRAKVLVVVLGAFIAHLIEIAVYGLAVYALATWLGAGTLKGSDPFSLTLCLYFSAETYTSLGFGDLTPVGPIRLVAGVEALNGLLLIAWSASFTYLAMERFWQTEPFSLPP